MNRYKLVLDPRHRSGIAATGRCFHLPGNSMLASGSRESRHSAHRKAVFLDRDGVLVEDTHFLREPGQLRILPAVPQALQMLREQFCLIVVTNQSGIAKGLFTEADLLAIHEKLVRQLSTQGAILDGFYYCPHHPEASVPEYKQDCECRKPKPGMFLRAAADWNIDLDKSFMVGDMPRDMGAARSAGVGAILINHRRDDLPGFVAVVANLLEAASVILAHAARGEAARPINTIGPLRPV